MQGLEKSMDPSCTHEIGIAKKRYHIRLHRKLESRNVIEVWHPTPSLLKSQEIAIAVHHVLNVSSIINLCLIQFL